MEKLEKTVYYYKTYDGEIFETKEAAEDHELRLCHKRIYANRKNYAEFEIFKVENEYELRAIFKNNMEYINELNIKSYPAIFCYSWDDNAEKRRYMLLEDLIKSYEETAKALKEINDINYWR